MKLPFCMAVAQTCSTAGDVAANVRRHTDAIRCAGAAGVDVLLFPELSLTGYALPLLAAYAQAWAPHWLHALQQAVDATGTTALLGMPLSAAQGKVAIATAIVRPHQPVAYYRKHHLHAGEAPYCVAGDRPEWGTDVAGRRCQLAICADTSHATHAQAAAAQGAEVYLASVLLTPEGYAADATLLRNHARQHHMAVCMANHGGPTGQWQSAGRSTLWDARGRVIVQAPATGEWLVVARQDGNGEWQDELASL